MLCALKKKDMFFVLKLFLINITSFWLKLMHNYDASMCDKFHKSLEKLNFFKRKLKNYFESYPSLH